MYSGLAQTFAYMKFMIGENKEVVLGNRDITNAFHVTETAGEAKIAHRYTIIQLYLSQLPLRQLFNSIS